MFRTILLLVLPLYASANCENLFNNRHLGPSQTDQAINCFEKDVNSSELATKANAYGKLSYLYFFKAQFYLESKMPTLLEGIALAEKGLLLFGKKYDVNAYNSLPATEKKIVGELLYNYGLCTSRYIDLAGKFEAIRRMDDIKKSMNTIMRIGEESVAHYGAHRTLGIFHMKVPAIAGGRIELSKNYLEKAVVETRVNGGVSSYPSNNVALSDLYYKLKLNEASCDHVKIVATLSKEDVKALNNGYYFESLEAVKDAGLKMRERGCQ